MGKKPLHDALIGYLIKPSLENRQRFYLPGIAIGFVMSAKIR